MELKFSEIKNLFETLTKLQNKDTSFSRTFALSAKQNLRELEEYYKDVITEIAEMVEDHGGDFGGGNPEFPDNQSQLEFNEEASEFLEKTANVTVQKINETELPRKVSIADIEALDVMCRDDLFESNDESNGESDEQ